MSGQDPGPYDLSYSFSLGAPSVELLLSEAVAAQRTGDIAAAEQRYLQILQQNARHPDANHLLGVIRNQQGRFEEAIKLLETAVMAQPGVAAFYSNLGNAQMSAGDADKAVACYRRALSIDPGSEYYNNLGFALASQEKFDEALDAFNQALELAPAEAGIHYNIANTYRDANRSARAAVHHYREAIRLQPKMWQAQFSLGALLGDLADKDEALHLYSDGVEANPDWGSYASYLAMLSYQRGVSSERIRQEHARWGGQFAARLEQPRQFPADATDKAVLNVGYVSPDFRKHAVEYFIAPLLAHHDRDGFRIFCYANVPQPDEGTARLQAYGHAWRDISQLGDEQVCDLIRADGIDILVDLAGHTAGNSLPVFARRPAPVQITWFGFPSTTGVPAMDYRFSDHVIDPDDGVARYTEKTWRLDGFYACYKADLYVPGRHPLPARERGHVTFVSVNAMKKLDEQLLACWARILLQSPGSHLLIKSKWADDEWVKERFLALFREAGVEDGRVDFEGQTDLDDYLALGARADIALDSYPYNGGITSFQSLAMGLPVVTLSGDTAPSRVGRSILTHLGLERLCAATEDEYVEIAASLAADPGALEALRASLPERIGGDCRDFVRGVEQAYRDIWRVESAG